jgi:hypothetical protein
MSFLSFLGGAVKVLVGGAIFLLCFFAGIMLMIQGKGLIAGILLILAFVGGLYAQYQRGKQPQRVG